VGVTGPLTTHRRSNNTELPHLLILAMISPVRIPATTVANVRYSLQWGPSTIKLPCVYRSALAFRISISDWCTLHPWAVKTTINFKTPPMNYGIESSSLLSIDSAASLLPFWYHTILYTAISINDKAAGHHGLDNYCETFSARHSCPMSDLVF